MGKNIINISSLIITEFRQFHGKTVEFNKPITLITGQNGTAKSTLLGMLAQPFSFGSKKEKQKLDKSAYINNYHGLKLASYVDIAGNSYTYPCDKIFRLSKKHDTPEKLYLYETKLKGIDFKLDYKSPLKSKKLLTVSQPRGEKLRFVTGPGISESISHKPGEGNFPHPVIYLSLGRLLPLAEVKSCNISTKKDELKTEESKWYNDAYKEIFSMVDEEPSSGLMETKEKKKSIVPLTKEYDGESCSAGQDNIGRIFTAILSFRRLKKSLEDHYLGGLLLIDELDATLHPSSQVKLIDFLCREIEDLSLQIVATTHSLYLIEHCITKQNKKVGIAHIKKYTDDLEINSNATLDDVKADLKNEAIPPVKQKKIKKISIVLEDVEAIKFLKFLISKDCFFRGKLKIANIKGKKTTNKASSISGRYLEIFANNAKKIPELEQVVFIPDGDMDWVKNTENKNVIALPGDKAIEKQIFEMLSALSTSDDFWNKERNYIKQVVIGNYSKLKSSDTDGIKKWYKEQQKQKWGRRGLTSVLELYYKKNKKACDIFLARLRNIVIKCC